MAGQLHVAKEGVVYLFTGVKVAKWKRSTCQILVCFTGWNSFVSSVFPIIFI
jgi:hypothetical protein